MNWTAESVERAIDLAKQGRSMSQIGKLLGVTRNAVAGAFKRFGFQYGDAHRPRPRAERIWTDRDLLKVCAMIDAGKDAKAIAARFKCRIEVAERVRAEMVSAFAEAEAA